MIPAPFSYARPSSIQEASSLLKADRAAPLAGGQSLLTDLKQRRRSVDLVVDLAGLGLKQITTTGTGVRVDAMVRQTTLMSDLKDGPFHLIYETGMAVGDPSIRARGTFIGALMAAEPQGDWAAAALALDAHLLISDGSRERRLPYSEWLASDRHLRPGELTIAAELIEPPAGARCGYTKIKHAAVGWNIASLAYVTAPGYSRLVVAGAVQRPSRLDALEQHMVSGKGGFSAELRDDLAALNCQGDPYASSTYRRHRLGVLVERVFEQ